MMAIRTQMNFKEFWNEGRKVIAPYCMILILFIVGRSMVSGFGTSAHLLGLVKNAVFLAFFALCQMVVICAGGGGLDLSVGAVASMGAIFGGRILQGSDTNLLLAFLLMALLGMLIGLCNGAMISFLNIPPLIMTLAMTSIVNGLIQIYSKGSRVSNMAASPGLKNLVNGVSFGISHAIYVLLIVMVVAIIIFQKSKYGVRLFGIGANEQAADLKGARVKVFRFYAYGVSSAIAAMTGLLLLGYLGVPYMDIGSSYVLPSVAAVTIGGISVAGGTGNYIGAVGGAVLLFVISALLTTIKMGEAGNQIVTGVIIIMILLLYSREKR